MKTTERKKKVTRDFKSNKKDKINTKYSAYYFACVMVAEIIF